jgi:3-phenylpropionate/cinnamic acid dioxygenase small subunit
MGDDARFLETLREERAIMDTLHQYCHAVDYGLEDAYVGAFTDDAVFDVRKPTGETLHREVGRDELAAYLAKYPKPPSRYNKHFMMDPMIELDDDSATVRSYFLAMRNGDDNKPVVGSFGRYIDRLVKVDGRWRIAERIAEVEAS